jgi:hypothetical protein
LLQRPATLSHRLPHPFPTRLNAILFKRHTYQDLRNPIPSSATLSEFLPCQQILTPRHNRRLFPPAAVDNQLGRALFDLSHLPGRRLRAFRSVKVRIQRTRHPSAESQQAVAFYALLLRLERLFISLHVSLGKYLLRSRARIPSQFPVPDPQGQIS